MDKKTVEMAETIIAQFTLLYTENTSLVLEVQQMTKTIQEEQQIKEEINSEFERIKGKLELVKQWETEVTILRKKNDWLSTQAQKITQLHNKMSIQAHNQLNNIKHKFSNSSRIKEEVNFGRLDQIKSEIELDIAPDSNLDEFD